MSVLTVEKAVKNPHSKSRRLWKVLAVVFGLIVTAYCAISIYGAYSFTTTGTRDLGPDTPTTYGMPFQNISFKSTDEAQLTLQGWWIPRPNSSRVLIMVHAKDGTRTFMLPISQKLWEQDYNILLFDMRGEGQSNGERVSYGQYEQYDVLGAVSYVKSKGFKPGNIGVVGWSMGATAAILAMSQTGDIKAGVADSSFADFERLANERFSATTGLPGFFFPGITTAARLLLNIEVSKASPEAAIKNLGGNLFLIHGTKDAEIPVRDFELLRKAGGKNIVEAWLVEGSEHVRSFRDHPVEYVQRVTAFFNRELNS